MITFFQNFHSIYPTHIPIPHSDPFPIEQKKNTHNVVKIKYQFLIFNFCNNYIINCNLGFIFYIDMWALNFNLDHYHILQFTIIIRESSKIFKVTIMMMKLFCNNDNSQ